MSQFRADLHCHSTCSDGTFSPVELIQEAKKIGLSGLSITDHDTINAYSTALPEAEKLGIKMVSGAEFSTRHRGVSVHILAYAFSLNDMSLQAFCDEHNERRLLRFQKMLDLTKKEGMHLDDTEMVRAFEAGDPITFGRPHLAQAMIEKGYVDSVQEAFKTYIGNEGSCYYPTEVFSVQETIDVIHAANGLAVIAHPILIKNRKVVNDLLKMDFDGIEGYYARFPEDRERQWVHKGKERAWLVTGGSDFHGTVKPQIPLGCSWVCEETFDRIYEVYEEANKACTQQNDF